MATTNAVSMTQMGIAMYSGTSGIWTQGATPGCHNLACSYAGGTFTIHGSDGTALSASNPGYVTMRSKGSSYYLKTIAVTANQSFTDGSGGSIDNARFGVTTGVNWSEDCPFYIYAVMNDSENTIAFMISRAVGVVTSPASTSISKSGSIINVNAADFYCLPDVTLTEYDSNPLLLIGAFRMQFAGATDSWTVQTTGSAIQDGIGQFHQYSIWTGPPSGQNGAATGSLFTANGGTAPTFSSNSCHYQIDPFSGMIHYFVDIQNDGGTDGSGAVNCQLVLPYTSNTTVAIPYCGASSIKYAGATTLAGQFYPNGTYTNLINITTGTVLTNSLFTNGSRYVVGDFIYRGMTY